MISQTRSLLRKQNGVKNNILTLAAKVITTSPETEVTRFTPGRPVRVANDPVFDTLFVDAVANYQS